MHMKETVLPESFEIAGWLLVAQWGCDFKGVRGMLRDSYGWVATHKATGRRIEFKPGKWGETTNIICDYLIAKNELYELTGRF